MLEDVMIDHKVRFVIEEDVKKITRISTILLKDEGVIVGSPGHFRFILNSKKKSFDKPTHFFPSAAKKIIKRLNAKRKTYSAMELPIPLSVVENWIATEIDDVLIEHSKFFWSFRRGVKL